MTSYAGKKIWLVGASEGIGEALVRLLARQGAQLVVSARSKEKIEALVASLPGNGHMAIALDVTKLESVQAAWQEIASRIGAVDIALYNAGTYDPLSAKEFNLQKTEQMVDVNFRGALRMLDSVLPVFVARNAGHIVLVASVASYSGLPRAIGYGASKAALLHLAENLKVDLKGTNIKIQAVCPGFVKTRLTDKNEFKMPFIIEPELAAQRMADGMLSNTFDINFPRRFTWILKFFRLLPYPMYFWLIGRLPEH